MQKRFFEKPICIDLLIVKRNNQCVLFFMFVAGL